MEIPRQVCASCNALGASRRQALRQEQGLRAGCAARAAGTLSRGERTGGPRRPRRGFRTPGPQFTSLARGVNGLICRLIILLPAGNAAKTSPTAPAAGIRSAAGVVGWREEQDSSRRSDDLGRVAGRLGVGETTAVGDLAAVPGGSITSPAILVSALTAAPAARPS